MNTSTAKDLILGQGFYLPGCDRKGTKPNFLYVVVEIAEDGIYAEGNIETEQGNLFPSTFWLPNNTVVEEFQLDAID